AEGGGGALIDLRRRHGVLVGGTAGVQGLYGRGLGREEDVPVRRADGADEEGSAVEARRVRRDQSEALAPRRLWKGVDQETDAVRQVKNKGPRIQGGVEGTLPPVRLPRPTPTAPQRGQVGQVPGSPRWNLQQVQGTLPRHGQEAGAAVEVAGGAAEVDRRPPRGDEPDEDGAGRPSAPEGLPGATRREGPAAVRAHRVPPGGIVERSRRAEDTSRANRRAVLVEVEDTPDRGARQPARDAPGRLPGRAGRHSEAQGEPAADEEAPAPVAQDGVRRGVEVPHGVVRRARDIPDTPRAGPVGGAEEDAPGQVPPHGDAERGGRPGRPGGPRARPGEAAGPGGQLRLLPRRVHNVLHRRAQRSGDAGPQACVCEVRRAGSRTAAHRQPDHGPDQPVREAAGPRGGAHRTESVPSRGPSVPSVRRWCSGRCVGLHL
ncbi:hypothetical protein THAOC_16826, partial [Thalassiosira oceanica]